MIRLTTNRLRLATHFLPDLRFSLPLWAALSFFSMGSFCLAQDPSVLELTPREPAGRPANDRPDLIPEAGSTARVLQSQASAWPLDPFGILPEEDSNDQEALLEPGGEQMADLGGEMEILPEPNSSDDGMDLLMRAPLHEAFAEIPLSTALPNPVVARRPPAAIEEMPPEYKPEGENVIWISGYWFWDEERVDFIWISGVWRDAPVGQQWIAGYWHEETGEQTGEVGFRWINGFWQSTELVELNYLPQPPEPIEVGPSMPAPSEDYFYVPGSWMYQQTQYVWRPGYYSVYVEDLVWVPPTYVWTPCGYLFRPGYWDKPIEERGLVFAPVFFRQPIYLSPQYFYRPTCVIDTGLGLLPHLFVRRNRSHYYFGDWYADRYLHQDFCGWSNLSSHRYFRRQYDPLFHYYSSPVARRHNRSIAHWAGLQHRHFASNVGLRPPTVFNASMVKQRFSGRQNFAHQPFNFQTMPDRQVFLGDTLERRAKLVSAPASDHKFQRLVRIDDRQQKNELEAINRQLQKQRRDTERELAKGSRSALQPTKVRLNPTVLTADPARLARKERESIRTQETQLKIRQKQTEAVSRAEAKQAEAAARAQVRRLENDQQKQQRDLTAQLKSQSKEENRQLNRVQRQPNSGRLELPALEGPEGPRPQVGNQGQTNPALPNQPSLDPQPRQQPLERSAERQLKSDQRRLVQQQNRQQLEQRRGLDTAQQQAQAAQRQAQAAARRQANAGPRQTADALQRQQAETPRPASDPTQTLRQSQDAARMQQRQLDAQQRQVGQAQRQALLQQRQGDQGRQSQLQQRQGEQAQRQAEQAQRQALLQQRQGDQLRQSQLQQRQSEQAQRQVEQAQRQAQLQQRQAQDAAQRQQAASQRASERSARDQQRQSQQQQRDSNRGRKKD